MNAVAIRSSNMAKHHHHPQKEKESAHAAVHFSPRKQVAYVPSKHIITSPELYYSKVEIEHFRKEALTGVNGHLGGDILFGGATLPFMSNGDEDADNDRLLEKQQPKPRTPAESNTKSTESNNNTRPVRRHRRSSTSPKRRSAPAGSTTGRKLSLSPVVRQRASADMAAQIVSVATALEPLQSLMNDDEDGGATRRINATTTTNRPARRARRPSTSPKRQSPVPGSSTGRKLSVSPVVRQRASADMASQIANSMSAGLEPLSSRMNNDDDNTVTNNATTTTSSSRPVRRARRPSPKRSPAPTGSSSTGRKLSLSPVLRQRASADMATQTMMASLSLAAPPLVVKNNDDENNDTVIRNEEEDTAENRGERAKEQQQPQEAPIRFRQSRSERSRGGRTPPV